jgi:hypothetical protein
MCCVGTTDQHQTWRRYDFGAPVLRDQGPIGRLGTARPILALTPCMPCSFGPLPQPRSEMRAQPTGLLEVTVTDRYIPLVIAACGTRVARPARMTLAHRDAVGSASTGG